MATETRQLPAPTFNISQLQQSFSQRGLSLEDLVALSGTFETPLQSLSYYHFLLKICWYKVLYVIYDEMMMLCDVQEDTHLDSLTVHLFRTESIDSAQNKTSTLL